MHKTLSFSLLFVSLLVISTSLAQEVGLDLQMIANLPADFVVTVVSDDLVLPVDMVRLPSGDFWVAEKGSGDPFDSVARVRLIPANETILSLSTTTNGEGGIAGLTLDPQFEANGYFYILYLTGPAAKAWGGEPMFRLSRFFYDQVTGLADPLSEQILLDIPAVQRDRHFGGGLAFDAAGHLYVGVGDMGLSHLVQDTENVLGSVLRVSPTAEGGYTVPADNPYVGTAGVDEIYVTGMRNPFKMHYVSTLARLVGVDVGEANWEEINVIDNGRNYGWPEREGPCPQGSYEPCPAAPAHYTDPLYAEPHSVDAVLGSAITALAYYDGLAFPERYQRKLFFANLNNKTIDYLDMENPTEAYSFGTNFRTIVDLEVTNNSLYALSINDGQLLEITYAPDGFTPPVLVATPSLTTSNSPISFTVSSTDNLPAEWQYRWDFGDGSPVEMTDEPAAVHQYAADGAYTVSMEVVEDNSQPFAPITADVVVYSGEPPQIELVNLTDNGRMLYHAGDQIQYTALRSTVEDLDSLIPYEWNIYLHHNQHTHPIVFGNPTEGGVLTAPIESHDLRANVWYRFELIMNTEGGLRIPLSVEIFPAVADVAVDGNLATLVFKLNGVAYNTPFDFRAIVGEHHQMAAPNIMVTGDGVYGFGAWQLPEGVVDTAEFEFVTPDQADVTLSGRYDYLRPPERIWLSMVNRP